METENLKIDNLLKVTAILEAGTARDPFEAVADPKKIDFIYGVAACGITPFEKSLYQKQAGDKVLVPVDLQKAGEFFGPFSTDILNWLPERCELFFKVGIEAVAKPGDSEVVKALASGGGCGNDCDCGCC